MRQYITLIFLINLADLKLYNESTRNILANLLYPFLHSKDIKKPNKKQY